MTFQDRGSDSSILVATKESVARPPKPVAVFAIACGVPDSRKKVPSIRTLPAEVQDLIIDQLHGDRVSLEACSLTCRAWLPRAHHHLFRSVKIDRCSRGASFKALIDGSPGIAKHIRHVEISGMKAGSWWSGDERFTRFSGWWPTLGQRLQRQGMSDSLEVVEWLRCILPESNTALSRVTRLTLSSLLISPELATVLHPYFDSVSELVVNGCQGLAFSDFLELRLAVPRVQAIRVVEARWLPCPVIPSEPTPTTRSTTVTTMEFSRKVDIVTIFDFIIRAGRYDQLTSLSCFVTSHASANALRRMLEALGPNLEHLGLGFSDVRDPTEILRSCDLTLIPSTGLRSLRLSCATTERFSTYRVSLSWILHVLSKISSPAIRDVIFSIPQRDLSALNLNGLISVFSHKRYENLEKLVFDVELRAEDLLQDMEVRGRLAVLGRTLKFNAICR